MASSAHVAPMVLLGLLLVFAAIQLIYVAIPTGQPDHLTFQSANEEEADIRLANNNNIDALDLPPSLLDANNAVFAGAVLDAQGENEKQLQEAIEPEETAAHTHTSIYVGNRFANIVLPMQLHKARPPRDSTSIRAFIGVVADHESIATLGQAAYATWYKQVSRIADVFFFVGECTNIPQQMADAVICLHTPDVYPPQLKEFLLWEYFGRFLVEQYDFFLKVDLDTYINAYHLEQLLRDATSARDTQLYLGKAAMGRPQEIDALGLDRPYCLGLGYVATAPAVKVMAAHIDDCLRDIASNHSDTEVCLNIQRVPCCILIGYPLDWPMLVSRQ